MSDNQPVASFWSGSPKTMFYMGLFVGLAASSMLALAALLGMIFTGHSLATSTSAIAAQAPGPTPTAPQPSQPDPSNPPSHPPVAVDEHRDHVMGNKNAKVTLIEYSDFQCPFCQRHEPTIAQALKDFPKDVRVVYRYFPLTNIHPEAEKSAEAAECVARLAGENAFWKMHDQLFQKQSVLSHDLYLSLAKSLGVNEAKFKTCLDGNEAQARIQEDASSGSDAGVNGTPATFVNGILISGAVPYQGSGGFKQALVAAGAKQ